jgi:hypothetical protein
VGPTTTPKKNNIFLFYPLQDSPEFLALFRKVIMLRIFFRGILFYFVNYHALKGAVVLSVCRDDPAHLMYISTNMYSEPNVQKTKHSAMFGYFNAVQNGYAISFNNWYHSRVSW